MYTKEEIIKKLREDPDWELPDDASMSDWDNYDDAVDEIEDEKVNKTKESEKSDTGSNADDGDYGDEDAPWPDDDDM